MEKANIVEQKYLWTRLRARLTFIKANLAANYNWVFLPGGPGLGSESLAGLTKILQLPGTIWHLDLPGDGSNIINDDKQHFSRWSTALIEAVSVLPNVILVAHSTGGMYALATPALNKILAGLVLLDSALDADWQKGFFAYMQRYPIANIEKLLQQFANKPSNALLKKITLQCAEYSFTKKGLAKGIALLKNLPYNYHSHEWSAEHFDQQYKAKWVPATMPTLILAGEKDNITPIELFTQSKKFQRKNIMLRAVKNAGHFPWIENPRQIRTLFNEYCGKLIKLS